MFDILPNTLSLVLTTLLPIYAAHKALSAPPTITTAQTLAPWLTYFLILSLASLLDPFLSILPFSAYLRLFLRLWLLLPGESQGASLAYRAYVQPFLHQHERDIETFINDVHGQGKRLAAEWMRQVVEWIKVQLLGQSAAQVQAHQEEKEANKDVPYTQRLLAVFNTPPTSNQTSNDTATTSNGTTAAATFNSALQQATTALAYAAAASTSTPWSSSSSAAPTHDVTQPQPHNTQTNLTDTLAALIPAHLSSPAERLGYVSAQKDRLRALLGAFEREEASVGQSLTPPAGEAADLKKSGSEADFDRIEHVEIPAVESEMKQVGRPGVQKTKSWGAWAWGGKGAAVVDGGVKKGKGVSEELVAQEKVLDEEGTGKSSAVEV